MEFDFVVIGGGSAGYAGARTARETGARVAVIDAGPDLGGLCILRGCMPSKTLIYSTEVLHLAREAEKFGLRIPSAAPDMPALLARKRAMVEEFASYRRGQLESDKYTLLRDRAEFVDEQTVRLMRSGELVRAKKFLIATGSTHQVPPVIGLAEAGAWTSDDVLELDAVPQSVIVLGGGVIACELAQYLRRLGSEVTQIQRSSLILKDHTEEASCEIMKVFRDEGINLFTGTHITQVARTAQGFEVTFEHKGQAKKVAAAHLLNALGRRPNVEGLNLPAAGVSVRSSGQIIVNDAQQTSNPAIYAAGDVAGPFEIVHLAVMQGELAAKHATGQAWEPVNYGVRTSVTFTDPQVASVGPLPFEPECQQYDLVEASYPFNDHGKSILMHATYGYVRAWADRRTGKLIGAECVGKDAGELMHALAVGVTLGATAKQLLKVQWYHPTLAEIWTYPLEDLALACE